MKCKNCGAELNGKRVCDYCGTRYDHIADDGNGLYSFDFRGKTYKARLVSVNAYPILMPEYRDENGVLVKEIAKERYRFEFETM